jgi:hypothetical protein
VAAYPAQFESINAPQMPVLRHALAHDDHVFGQLLDGRHEVAQIVQMPHEGADLEFLSVFSALVVEQLHQAFKQLRIGGGNLGFGDGQNQCVYVRNKVF